jgi:hypothetical protein
MKRERTEDWAKWRGLVSEQIASGRSVAVFCRERDIRDWKFYEWKKRLRKAGEAQFLAVKVKPAELVLQTAPLVPSKAIEIMLTKGRSLMVERGFDAMHLRALLSVLEAEG